MLPTDRFSAMVFSPIFGRLADKVQHSRYVVLTALSFSITGHMALLTMRHVTGLIIGKIFIGIGMSCDGAILGQLGRETSQNERTRLFSTLFSFRQTGLIVFPLCYLKYVNVFDVGRILINNFLAFICGKVRFNCLLLLLMQTTVRL